MTLILVGFEGKGGLRAELISGIDDSDAVGLASLESS
jgi:hypothetical protein